MCTNSDSRVAPSAARSRTGEPVWALLVDLPGDFVAAAAVATAVVVAVVAVSLLDDNVLLTTTLVGGSS